MNYEQKMTKPSMLDLAKEENRRLQFDLHDAYIARTGDVEYNTDFISDVLRYTGGRVLLIEFSAIFLNISAYKRHTRLLYKVLDNINAILAGDEDHLTEIFWTEMCANTPFYNEKLAALRKERFQKERSCTKCPEV